jgi:hypothetical protein
MHFFITADSNYETRTGDVITKISGPMRRYFLEKDYGSSIEGIVIVFMCRDPKIAFKQRIRFSKKDKKLYMDTMMDYESMVSAPNDEARFNLIKEKLVMELPLIINKYKFPEFDQEKFILDLQNNLIFSPDRSA